MHLLHLPYQLYKHLMCPILIKKAKAKIQSMLCDLPSYATSTLFRMCIFGAAHGWEGGQKDPPSLKSVTLILHW